MHWGVNMLASLPDGIGCTGVVPDATQKWSEPAHLGHVFGLGAQFRGFSGVCPTLVNNNQSRKGKLLARAGLISEVF